MADPAALAPDEMLAWRGFVQMYHRLERHLARHLTQEAGLSGADFEVLTHLLGSPDGFLQLSELVELTHWERSRLSHQLRRMQDRGLVRRRDRPGRGWDVVLTAEGRSLIERARPANRERVRELFVDALGPDDLRSIAMHSAKITAALDAHIARGCSAMPPDGAAAAPAAQRVAGNRAARP